MHDYNEWDWKTLQRRVATLDAENERFRAAIRAHYEQTVGHSMCWENDVELWKAVGINMGYPHGTTPPWCEFMAKCAEYRASREPGRTRASKDFIEALEGLSHEELLKVAQVQQDMLRELRLKAVNE